MATTTCGTCSKIILFIVNFIFWLSGIAVLGLGIWVSIDRNTMEFLKLFDYPLFRNVGFTMIGVGGFVTIIGFIGCFGACHESKCMLWTYFISILFLFLAEIVCMALIFAYTEEVKSFVKTKMNDSLKQDYEVSRTGFVKAVDGLQTMLMCCGNYNHSDWRNSEWYKVAKTQSIVYNVSVPESCCKRQQSSDGTYTYTDPNKCQDIDVTTNNFRYSQGCYEALYNKFMKYIWFIGGVGIGVAVLQFLIMVVTVFLLRNLTDDFD